MNDVAMESGCRSQYPFPLGVAAMAAVGAKGGVLGDGP